jgi:hypothetical protein
VADINTLANALIEYAVNFSVARTLSEDNKDTVIGPRWARILVAILALRLQRQLVAREEGKHQDQRSEKPL